MIKNKSVTTLLNEYSVPLASIIDTGFGGNTGTIEMENTLYKYRIGADLKEINIYKANSPAALLACKVQVDKKLFSLANYINFILFSLVWFVYSSKEIRIAGEIV